MWGWARHVGLHAPQGALLPSRRNIHRLVQSVVGVELPVALSSSRVGVNDIPPERADVLMDCWGCGRRDAIYSDKSARQRTSRLCDCVFFLFFFLGGGEVWRGLRACWWSVDCGGGALSTATSPLRDALPEGFNFWRLVVGLGTTVCDNSTRRRVRCQVWLLFFPRF